MTEEINYKIGDVVMTPKGVGEIIFKDKPSPSSSIKVKWLYMLEIEDVFNNRPSHT